MKKFTIYTLTRKETLICDSSEEELYGVYRVADKSLEAKCQQEAIDITAKKLNIKESDILAVELK